MRRRIRMATLSVFRSLHIPKKHARRIWDAVRIGLGIGLIFSLFTCLFFWQEHGADYAAINATRDGLTYFLTFGLISALLSMIIEHMDTEILPTEILHWSWSNVWTSLWSKRHRVQSFFVGLCFALGIGLASGLSTLFSQLFSEHNLAAEVKLSLILITGFGDAVTYGLTFGIAYWLLFGLRRGLFSYDLLEEDRINPNEGIRRSLDNGIRLGLYGGLIIGFIVLPSTMLSFGLHAGLEQGFNVGWLLGLHAALHNLLNIFNLVNVGLVMGLQAALFGGLLVCLLMGGLACFRHLVLRLLLSRKPHEIPFNYSGFLDTAAKSMLLHKVGGRYIFIHRQFQDYMASLVECRKCGYRDDRHNRWFCPKCNYPLFTMSGR